MPSKALSLSNPELLAEYVRESELTGFFEKRLAAPPDHMAMLIRNGEIIDTYKGAHFSVGGVLNSLRSLFVGSSHISILLADLKPFSLQSTFKALTQDHVMVTGMATLELQVNPDQPKNVMGLVNTSGFLTQDEVLSRFKPHLTDRVMETAISRVNADEIRGDRGLQDHIQAEIMREVERVAGDLGLIVRAVSFEWALNDVEVEAMNQAVLDREQEKLDRELEHLGRNIERSKEATTFQLKSDLDLAKLANETEEELEHLVLNRQIRFSDARSAAERRQELDEVAHQLTLMKEQRIGRFENQLAECDQLVDVAQRRLNLTQVQIDIDRLTRAHKLETKRLEAETEREITEQSGLLDIKLADQSSKQRVDELKRLQELEQSGEDAEVARENLKLKLRAELEIEKLKAESNKRVSELHAGSKMTPEQILAVTAENSDQVLIEQAKAKATNNAEVQAAMRELVDQSQQHTETVSKQALEMFQMGMNGTVGVANGVGQAAGGTPGATAANSPQSSETVECSKCGRPNEATFRFCIGCGKQLRS